MPAYDVIVLGTGGIGSAALAVLARRGLHVLGLDRFPPAHDRGSSHGQTRMIRQAYFEHPDYVPLVLRAYRLWAELEERRGTRLFRETGLLEVGPDDGVVLPGVVASAQRHKLEIERFTGADVARRWPGFRVPEGMSGVFEPRAGYLRVEPCVLAHLEDAQAAGATLRTGETVTGWRATSGELSVETDRDRYTAGRLVIAAGPWAGTLLSDLNVPLLVRRKPQFWFATESPIYKVENGCPAFLYELPSGVYYGFPEIDAEQMKIAEHSGGQVVDDPTNVDRRRDSGDQARVETFIAECLPFISRRVVDHSVCMYTMSPDAHFIVDRHPADNGVVFAAGLSGHGFKFAPVLGEALADLAIDGRTSLPIEFLSCRRAGLGVAR